MPTCRFIIKHLPGTLLYNIEGEIEVPAGTTDTDVQKIVFKALQASLGRTGTIEKSEQLKIHNIRIT